MMFSFSSTLDEIRRLHDDKQTGILTLTDASGERLDVFFREGLIEAASSNSGARRLGDYLVKGGHVPARELDAVHAEAKRQNIFFGEAVVRKNLADPAYVGAAARNQVMDLLERAFAGGFSVSCFTPSLRSYFAPARISFQHLLLELARGAPPAFEADPETLIFRVSDMDLALFPWHPEEIFVLKELKNPTTFRSLQKATGFDERLLKKVVNVLFIVEALETAKDTELLVEERTLALPALGFAYENLIPVVSDAAPSEKLSIARSEYSASKEQIRNLKVQIRETQRKVFTISSPEAQDGKSFVSMNLALSLSEDPGRRVILLDCDLREPSVAEYLGVSQEPGLLQYLGSSTLGPYCFVRRFENLYFMTTGGGATNPIEILSMRKMKQLIDDLRNDFDAIILDAPSFSPMADARVITALSDALIMVIRQGKTSSAAVEHAFKAVDRSKLVGVVFNYARDTAMKTQPFEEYSVASNSNGSRAYLEP